MAGQAGWQLQGSGPEAYERYIVPAFMGTWAKNLVARAALVPGERVLDVACGTGVVAREAAGRVADASRVVGMDVNAAMIEAARRIAQEQGLADIAWHHGDVTTLPFPDESFDVALCQQSLQYFPIRVAGLRKIRRVLRPGGRLLVSTWRADERQRYFGTARAAIASVLGPATAALSAGTSLSAREELRALLTTAGFSGIHISLEVLVLRYASLDTFLPGWLSATPLAAAVQALSEAERMQILASMREQLRDYADDDGLAVPTESHIARAIR